MKIFFCNCARSPSIAWSELAIRSLRGHMPTKLEISFLSALHASGRDTIRLPRGEPWCLTPECQCQGQRLPNLTTLDANTRKCELGFSPTTANMHGKIDRIHQKSPFFLGSDANNESISLNTKLVRYYAAQGIMFTSCCQYKRKDQAYARGEELVHNVENCGYKS